MPPSLRGGNREFYDFMIYDFVVLLQTFTFLWSTYVCKDDRYRQDDVKCMEWNQIEWQGINEVIPSAIDK